MKRTDMSAPVMILGGLAAALAVGSCQRRSSVAGRKARRPQAGAAAQGPRGGDNVVVRRAERP